MNSEVVSYIISFLLQTKEEGVTSAVSYGEDRNARVIIDRSCFFDEGIYMTNQSMPVLPLQNLNGIPVLFGTPSIYEEKGQTHIGADLIASSYFLLSRYEECIRRDVRDQHGRLMGKESLPYRADFFMRPIVDEYGVLLRSVLRDAGVAVSEPKPDFAHIWLTHDIDHIWTWDRLFQAVKTTGGNFLKHRAEKLSPLSEYFFYAKKDPIYTFPYIVKKDNAVRAVYGSKCTPLYFAMGCTQKTAYDNGYLKKRRKTKRLLHYLQKERCEIGCHISYAASLNPLETGEEIQRISKITQSNVTKSRNHYLASREPEQFLDLIRSGITDDFTMGYADVVGFRIGTCRAVRWIDPMNCILTELILHPMTVMECTLDGSDYMNIKDEDTAFARIEKMVGQVHQHGGEIVFLWHNTSFSRKSNSYHTSLYEKTIGLLTSNLYVKS